MSADRLRRIIRSPKRFDEEYLPPALTPPRPSRISKHQQQQQQLNIDGPETPKRSRPNGRHLASGSGSSSRNMRRWLGTAQTPSRSREESRSGSSCKDSREIQSTPAPRPSGEVRVGSSGKVRRPATPVLPKSGKTGKVISPTTPIPPRSRKTPAGSSRNVRPTPTPPRSRKTPARSSRNAMRPTTPSPSRSKAKRHKASGGFHPKESAAALSYYVKQQSSSKISGGFRLRRSPTRSPSPEQQTAPAPDRPLIKKAVTDWFFRHDKERQETLEGTPQENCFRLFGHPNRLYGIDNRNHPPSPQRPLRPEDTLRNNDPSPKPTPVPPSSPMVLESEPDAVAREPFPFNAADLPDDGLDDYITSFDAPTQPWLADLTPIPEIPSQLYIIQKLNARLGGARSMTTDQRLRIVSFAESFRQIEKSFYVIDESLQGWFFGTSETSYDHIYGIICVWYEHDNLPYNHDQMWGMLEVLHRVAGLEYEIQMFGHGIGCFGVDGSCTHFSREMSVAIICERYGYDRIGEGMGMVDFDAREPGDFEMPT